MKSAFIAAGLALAAAAATAGPHEGGRRGAKGRPGDLLIYDANGNGQLDAEERETLKQDREAARARRQARMIERFDTNKDGKLDEQEKAAAEAQRQARRAEFVKKFDANGDGSLDATERAAAREELGGRHRERERDRE